MCNLSTSALAALAQMNISVWVRREPFLETSSMSEVDSELESKELESNVLVAEPTSPQGWEVLEQTVRDCKSCPLHATRAQTVFGVGNRNAQWVIVGEAPGAEEDRQGEPFVGPAGLLLNEMLLAIGLRREDVYIANVLKCRPPNNRTPKLEEIVQCLPFLHRQIELINPKILLATGAVAAQSLLSIIKPIGVLRGRVYQYGSKQISLVVTYHPAYLLRSPREKKKAWDDLSLAWRTFQTLQK
ncbi:uracil-DNA glycosylase [Gammaproteobacteria bacterium]